MLLYFIIVLCIIVILGRAFIKIKYNFWSIQPVFHLYDLHYWLCPPGIINQSLPIINKYTKINDISFIKYKDLTDDDINEFVHFIQSHYLNTTTLKYLPTSNNITPYFTNSTNSYFSIYKKNTEIISVMTSRLLNVTIDANNFMTYYVDYLCVKDTHRKSGIAQQMIQTHEYNQRINTTIPTSLFKREHRLNALIPLVIYQSYVFKISKMNNTKDIHTSLRLLLIDTSTLSDISNFVIKNAYRFELVITPNTQSIDDLILSDNIFIFGLYQGSDIMAIYLFRDASTVYNNKRTVNCFASINITTTEEFINGFYKCIESLKQYYSYIIVEDISHNHYIVNDITKHTSSYSTSPTAYYFYNFATRPILANDSFIIN
jgi:hypothetical protein